MAGRRVNYYYRRRNALANCKAEDFIQDFELNHSQMKQIVKVLSKECQKGLNCPEDAPPSEAGTPMIYSHITQMPQGKETAQVLSLHFIKNILRVELVELQGRKELINELRRDFRLTDSFINCSTAVLFDHFSIWTADAIKCWNIDKRKRIPVALIFPAACRYESLRDAIVIGQCKEFPICDIVGQNISKCLDAALQHRGLNLSCVAAVSDAVALFGCSYVRDNRTSIAVSIGRCIQAAYAEKMKFLANAEHRFDAEYDPNARILMCPELGKAADNNSLDQFRNRIDLRLDESSENQGVEILEKMSSGRYVCELIRLAILSMYEQRIIDFASVPPILLRPDSIPLYWVIDMMLNSPRRRATPEQMVLFLFDLPCMAECDIVCIKHIVSAIVERSACLVACSIAVLLDRFNNDSEVVIAIDGDLVTMFPQYCNLIGQCLRELIPASNFKLSLQQPNYSMGCAFLVAAEINTFDFY